MKPQTAAILALFATMSLSGCLGPGSSNWALEATRIDDVHEHGKTGQGIRIAVIDTGFDPAHPTLKHLVDGSTKNGEAIAYRDFLNGDSGIELASDDDGHGSHVLSILAAKPASVGFLQEADFHGVAPGATYLIARVCNHDTCDVSVVDDAVNWARSQGADIITLTVDLGMVDLEAIRQRALSIGAVEALTVDGKDTLISEFLMPSLQAGTVYEDQYPLATALGRPLIARCLVEAAREHGAYAIAHGCTGKGNDQDRLDVSVGALAPDLKVIARARE